MILCGRHKSINPRVDWTTLKAKVKNWSGVNCNITGNRDRIYPIRVIRNRTFTLVYNPNHTGRTSNTTLDGALAMITGQASEGKGIAASWVLHAKEDPAAEALVHRLHHRPEYELYHRVRDPLELKNEIDNPGFAPAVARLKARLHDQLSAWGDADPIRTERALVNGKSRKK